MSTNENYEELEETKGKEAVPEGTTDLVLRFIQPNSAVNHDVEVDFSADVKTLKEEMESEISVPADQQLWFYEGKALPDDSSLNTYVHFAGATVEVRKRSDYVGLQESSNN